MKARPSRPLHSSGFTLVEILVSIAILTIILVALAQMFTGAGISISNGGKRLDADGQARMFFDRLATDLAGMSKRPDIDFLFSKQAGNDRCFFYSESPAYLASTTPSGTQGTASLIGYQINSSYQLERLGYGLNWDQASATAGSMNFLAFPTNNLYTPAPSSTINDGNSGLWSTVIATDGITTNYHVMADMVFRFEYCFLLKDGTYSINPVETASPSAWPTTATFNGSTFAPTFFVSNSGPPTQSSDYNQKYIVGSRWWDSTNNRAFICLNPTGSAAVWRPLGWDDVAGVVVTIALLDDNSRKIVTTAGLTTAAGQLPDPVGDTADLLASPPLLMAAIWQGKVTAGIGLPVAAASQVRIYQRCIYLNNDTNL